MISSMTETPAICAVTGSIAFLEKIALPPGAVVSVRLVDVATSDAPAVLAAAAIPVEAQVPVPYALTVDSDLLDPSGSLSVWARLRSEVGTWQTDTDNPVTLTDGVATVDVIVRRLPESDVPA